MHVYLYIVKNEADARTLRRDGLARDAVLALQRLEEALELRGDVVLVERRAVVGRVGVLRVDQPDLFLVI